MQEHNERIKGWMGWCLIGVAATIELIQTLLELVAIGVVLNPIITIARTFLFWVWGKLLGVSFTGNPKNLATMATQAIIGLIPGLDILPEFTLSIFIIVKITQSEDRGGVLGKAAGAVSAIKNPKSVTNIASYKNAAPAENMRKAA